MTKYTINTGSYEYLSTDCLVNTNLNLRRAPSKRTVILSDKDSFFSFDSQYPKNANAVLAINCLFHNQNIVIPKSVCCRAPPKQLDRL